MLDISLSASTTHSSRSPIGSNHDHAQPCNVYVSEVNRSLGLLTTSHEARLGTILQINQYDAYRY